MRSLFSALVLVVACGNDASFATESEPSSDRVAKSARPAIRLRRSEASMLAAARQGAAALPKEAMSRSMLGLKPVRRADGVIRLDLEGRFQHASVAVLDEQGQLHSACIDGPPAASATTENAP